MRDPQVILRQVLKDSGYSVTPTRLKVFSALETHDAKSPKDIYVALKGLVDRASVYRTINLYEKLGIVQRVYVGWKYLLELTDKYSAHHHHLVCIGCQKFQSIELETGIEEIIQSLSAKYGHEPIGHQLEIQGLCASCQLNQKRPRL